MQLASKFWPTRHRRFEEMCALAVTGQLGGPQMCELDEHIATCDSCRKYLESIAQVSVQTMPLLAEKHGPPPASEPPHGMRERFLSRLASEGSGHNGASLRASPITSLKPNFTTMLRETVEQTGDRAKSAEKSRPKLSVSLWRWVAAVMGCLVIAAGGFYAGTRRTTQPPAQVTQAAPSGEKTTLPATTATPAAIEADRVGELERQKSDLEARLVSVKQQLATVEIQKDSLSKDLAAAKEQLASLTAQVATKPEKTSSTLSPAASEQIAGLQAQVERLSRRLAESDASLAIQKQTSDELSARLELTSADLQRERDLKTAKNEMGELAASRNLHIVDVYDADPNGRRTRSFGRVFYIEGKSLVFYAYDLDDPGRFKTNVAFHVWGGKAGVKEVTHSLGILHKDDAGQNRWAMTFDDPHVLAQINSVFVTAESVNKHYVEPHGKKVLYAYFGSPANHP